MKDFYYNIYKHIYTHLSSQHINMWMRIFKKFCSQPSLSSNIAIFKSIHMNIYIWKCATRNLQYVFTCCLSNAYNSIHLVLVRRLKHSLFHIFPGSSETFEREINYQCSQESLDWTSYYLSKTSGPVHFYFKFLPKLEGIVLALSLWEMTYTSPEKTCLER